MEIQNHESTDLTSIGLANISQKPKKSFQQNSGQICTEQSVNNKINST